MHNPKVSIIIPAYNVEKEIEKTLHSVINQTFQDWELLIVNDGSTDYTQKTILDVIEENENRNILVFEQENQGPSAARNFGIKKARGEYLFFVDADDWIVKEALEILINAMEREGVDLVCAGYFEINDRFKNGLKLHDFHAKNFQKVLNRQEYQQNLFNGVSGVLWGKLFKNAIFKKHAIRLNPKVRFSEDLLVVLEYSTLIEKVFIVEDPIYYYNRRGNLGLSRKLKESNIQDLKLTNAFIYSYKNLLPVINIDEVLKKREANFIVQYLKDNLQSFRQFKDAIDLIKEEFKPDALRNVNKSKEKMLIVKFLTKERFVISFALLKTENTLKTVKRKIGL